MSFIRFENFDKKFRINQPVGDDALDLYCLVMDALEAKGALLAMASAGSDGLGTIAAARRVAAARGIGLAAVKATLVGSTVDGAVITADTFRKDYTQPGRQLEPYIVAVVAWDRLGFLSVTPAKKPEEPKKPEGSKVTGDSV